MKLHHNSIIRINSVLGNEINPRLKSIFFLLVILSLCNAQLTNAQEFTQSELPIVIIETPIDIPDEPKTEGSMKIIYGGENVINHINDPQTEYDGPIAIETRGNSTQLFDKKSYSLELKDLLNEDNPQNLLNMGADEDWILHAMVIDKTQLRIPLSFHLFQEMGHYASEWRFVELIVNGNYRGLYILTEKIKRDDDRLDISKLTEDDTAEDDVTGGYILSLDWLETDPNNFFFSSFESHGGGFVPFQYYYPKPDKITAEQKQYIEGFMFEFEEALYSENYTNSNGVRYTEYIDVKSFADFLLLNELSKNSDGYRLSSFIHKDHDSIDPKLKAGPVWDFDQAFGLSKVCSGHRTDGWIYMLNQERCEHQELMPLWWQTMMNDPLFQNFLACRWQELRSDVLHSNHILGWIDEQATRLENPIDRNFTKWEFIGFGIWPEPHPVAQTYSEEIIDIKEWILERLFWMDQNLPGNSQENTLNQGLNCELNTITELQLFPNPSGGNVYFYSHPEKQYNFTIYNSLGQLVQKFEHENYNGIIDLTGYPKGIYLVHINSTDPLQIEKIIIE